MNASRFRLIVILVFAFSFLGSMVNATSVIAPSFPELVSEAQIVVRARVTAVRCAWVESPQGRVIKTFVRLAVQKSLKGEAPAELTLQFLGGEVAGESMWIAGTPRFAVGQVEIVFVAGNGVRFCPLIGMMHGRYRVKNDGSSGREYVARDDGIPLESEHDVQLPHGGAEPKTRLRNPSRALSPDSFEQKISAEVIRRAALP